MDEKEKLRKGVLANLRAVLLSVKGSCPLSKINGDYYMLMGEGIPFRKLGYDSLVSFVTNQSAFTTSVVRGELMVDATADSKSAHIVNMIERQKNVPKKRRKNSRFAPVRSHVSNRMPDQRHLVPISYDKKAPAARKKYTRSITTPSGSAAMTGGYPNDKQTKAGPNQSPPADRLLRSKESIPARMSDQRAPERVSQPPPPQRKTSTEPKKPVARANSMDTTYNHQRVLPTVATRQTSLHLEVELLKSIPKELLRDVPLNDISFSDILDRTLSPRGNKTPSSSSSSVDNSSVFSYPEVTHNDKSNPTSPKTEDSAVIVKQWNGAGTNSKSSVEVFATPAPATSRGRGRFLRPPTMASLSPVGPVLDLFDTLAIGNRTQTAMLDANLSDDERKLHQLLNELDVNCVPDIKITKRLRKSGPPLYDGQIKIGNEIKCSTWPDDHLTEQAARDSVIRTAYTEVQKKYAHVARLAVSSPEDVATRLIPMVAEHPTGVWSDTVQQMYMDKFQERLPQNWVHIASKNNVRIECAANEKYILSLSETIEEMNGVQNNGYLMTDSGPEGVSNIAEAAIPVTDSFLSVVITCASSALDVSFRVIGTVEAEKYRRATKELEQYFSVPRQRVPIEKVTVGRYFAVPTNSTWMRVRVLEHPQQLQNDGSEIEVLCSFVDHGHEYSVSVANLYEFPVEFCKIPAQAIHCCLVGLEDLIDFESVIMPYLEELVGKHMFAKILDTDASETILNIVLFDTSGPEDVNVNLDILSRIGAEVPTPTLKTDGSIQEMNVVYVDGRGHVFLHQGEGSTFFFELMKNVVMRVDENQGLEYVKNAAQISKDLVYLARYTDGDLYRCVVQDIMLSRNEVVVSFIDYGNTLTIDFNKSSNNLLDLGQLSNILVSLPPQCIKAALYHNVPSIPPELGDLLLANIGDVGVVLVKVIVPADKPTQVPVVELFRRSQDESLFSINRALGLLMRVPKDDDGNNNTDHKSMANLYDLSTFPSSSTFPSTGDLPKPVLPQLGKFVDVNIPSAVSPWNFFIQPYVDGNELKEWMCSLQDYYNTGPGSKKVQLSLEDIQPGECYVAHHSDKTWYRACVNQTIEHTSISAFFVDFGLYVVLNSHQLQPLDKKFKARPFLAIKARLTGIRPRDKKWQVDDCRTFQSLVVSKQFVAVVQEIGHDILQSSDIVLSVKLIDTTTEDDINISQLLIERGIAVQYE